MVFKRRTRKPLLRAVAEFFWPRGGWRRAATYVLHRMRRLPDTPERICIGIAAGVYVSFLPLYGFHFLSAALVAWVFRGNILAALLGTFYGNPLTFPFMAMGGLELGSWLLGGDVRLTFGGVMAAIGRASSELSHNLMSVFTGDAAHWTRLYRFFDEVYLPYMVGGLILGVPFALLTYYLHLPLVRAYQRLRQKRLAQRFELARRRQRGPGKGPDKGETP